MQCARMHNRHTGPRPTACSSAESPAACPRRQLSRTQVDPASIERIFVTHLHGDHCFGLAQMLAALDSAKRKGSTPPEAQRNYVYGPPGTVELLQASLVLTSLQKQLQVCAALLRPGVQLVCCLCLLCCC